MLLCLYLSDSEDFSVAWWEVGGGGGGGGETRDKLFL